MDALYSLENSRVLYAGRGELKHIEVSTAVLTALRRKLRLGGHDRSFFRHLRTYGQASLTWNFVHRISSRDDQWATFEACALESDSYQLDCLGPQAEKVIERINRSLEAKRTKRQKKRESLVVRARNAERRRKKKKFRAHVPAPVQTKKVKGPRAVASHKHEKLTRMFGKTDITWKEALAFSVNFFDITHDGRRDAVQIANYRLMRSLERTGNQFAQFRRGSFVLQFTVPDGRWRGFDLARFTVSCTKDNHHPLYRRMRTLLKRELLGHSLVQQRMRRAA